MKDREIVIGKRIKVRDAVNRTQIGMEGQVIDETKNTIVIKTSKGTKKLIKKLIKFEIK